MTLPYRLLLAVLALVGAFGAGYHRGYKVKDMEVRAEEAKIFQSQVSRALSVADQFIGLGKSLVGAMSAGVNSGQETVKLGVRHVSEKPEAVDSGILDSYLIELRNCQIDRIYKASDRPLPRERSGATCPPAVPVEQ